MSEAPVATPPPSSSVAKRFLAQDGALALLVEIGRRDAPTYGTLRDEFLPVLSSAVLQRRLLDGEQQGLWTYGRGPTASDGRKRYRLTATGTVIYRAAVEEELDQLFRDHRRLTATLAEKTEAVLDDTR